jgi:hypothetical protein
VKSRVGLVMQLLYSTPPQYNCTQSTGVELFPGSTGKRNRTNYMANAFLTHFSSKDLVMHNKPGKEFALVVRIGPPNVISWECDNRTIELAVISKGDRKLSIGNLVPMD